MSNDFHPNKSARPRAAMSCVAVVLVALSAVTAFGGTCTATILSDAIIPNAIASLWFVEPLLWLIALLLSAAVAGFVGWQVARLMRES